MFGAGAGALAVLVERPRAGREVRVLVQRDGQHAGVVVEGGLRAVAVVDVPVNDRDALEAAVRQRVVDRDGGVAEQAEAHAGVGHRVVPGRADERERVAHRAVEHGVHGGDDAAGRQQRDLERPLAERRRAVSAVAARRGGLLADRST